MIVMIPVMIINNIASSDTLWIKLVNFPAILFQQSPTMMPEVITIWLVVWLPFFIFPGILGIIIPIDSYFSEGFKPPTSTLWLFCRTFAKDVATSHFTPSQKAIWPLKEIYDWSYDEHENDTMMWLTVWRYITITWWIICQLGVYLPTYRDAMRHSKG